ncbi:DUF7289 family protein [Haloprofundus salinisoli]|uniref:DUF7289 family protein n=1 Tax=Haloprofundus salinisoli TaxID=2876193 RepID=UPI001CCBFAE5|nr:hypothetical protein [Haloprofundus salinisoli]
MSAEPTEARRRAQANVVGVALLLGVTVISLGALTASIGVVVEENAASADATRVADDFDAALDPVETTGPARGRVSFTDGSLRTAERSIRLLNDSGVVVERRVDALVYESGDRRVAFLGGGIVRGRPGRAVMYEPPPVAASDDVLLVGVARLNASESTAISGSRASSVVLETNVSHERRTLAADEYRLAVETETPRPWERQFEQADANVTRRDFDGDGVESAVAAFDDERVAYVVVHDMRLEVRRG